MKVINGKAHLNTYYSQKVELLTFLLEVESRSR